jgi:hypothetical protein
MGKVLYFRKDCGAKGAPATAPASDSIAGLLRALADEQIRSAEQLEGLLTRLEVAGKSLMKIGAASPASQKLLMEHARKIEIEIGSAREKLREFRRAAY